VDWHSHHHKHSTTARDRATNYSHINQHPNRRNYRVQIAKIAFRRQLRVWGDFGIKKILGACPLPLLEALKRMQPEKFFSFSLSDEAKMEKISPRVMVPQKGAKDRLLKSLIPKSPQTLCWAMMS
jgi:hypothetical protein